MSSIPRGTRDHTAGQRENDVLVREGAVTLRSVFSRTEDAPDEATWQAFLQDVIRQTPMPDYLHYGEPYPALNGIVLSIEQHRQLVTLTELFSSVFEKATTALARDPVALERLGFPWVAIELLSRESPEPHVFLGRFDFLLERDGAWQLLEYNADTPSGPREVVVVEGRIAHALGGRMASLARSGDHFSVTVQRNASNVFEGIEKPARGRRVFGIMTDAGYAEDLAQAAFLASLIMASEPAFDVVYGDIDNLYARHGRLCLLGRQLDALYRYYPFETLLGTSTFVNLFDATTAGRLRLLNGLRGLLAQNKGVMAWIWERRLDEDVFTAAERSAIQSHLPAVRWIQDLAPTASPRGLVLKQVFGREGEEVYLGDQMTPEDLARCRAWGTYVTQRFVETAPVDTVVQTSGGPEVRGLWPVVGSFVSRGRWAGYYTRLGERVTTGHAKFGATFWERNARR